MEFKSPAKINLFLKILGKREDGYHELVTHMQAISLFDTLTIKESSCDSFTCSDPSLTNSNNLVLKALALFRSLTNIQTPVAIHLDKKIPHGAGLGGGSGNAATTLWGLSQLFSRPIDFSLSAALGSDVPFFFSSGSAICRGRGELYIDHPSEMQNYTIFKPSASLSTPLVFRELRPTDLHIGKNDLEPPALRLEPSLQQFKQQIESKYSCRLQMTGSGSAFFAPGAHPEGVTARSIIREQNEWYS